MDAALEKQTLRLLLIEDNPSHAALIERQLRLPRYESVDVQWVNRFEEGMRRLMEDAYDAVLLDLSLPDSDIHSTLQGIGQARPGVPVIVLTALDDVELASEALQQGAEDYLVKDSLNGQLLLRAIRYARERIRARAELQRYSEQLARSNRELQGFARTLAHEIKSPLALVVYCCEILQRKHADAFDAESLGFLQDAQRAVSDIGELLNALLEYARVGADDRPFEPVDCDRVLSEVLDRHEERIRELDARVQAERLPTVVGHPQQVRRLFHNLIDNALKFRRADRAPRVQVSCQRADGYWQFEIRDNGVGIAEKHFERIFQLFQRLHGASEYPGTGVGLAYSRRVVQCHGGRMWVESDPSLGSTFCFTWPVDPPTDALRPTTEP